MAALQIAKNIYWVGAIDWNIRSCGAYTTPRGTTYNAYLIVGKKVALIDTVKAGFGDELLARVKEVIDPSRIDYYICQHAEGDHAGAFPEIMKALPNAQVIVSQAGKPALTSLYGADWNAKAVKTADTLSLGDKTLTFIEAKMLHWPDNMFTYVQEDKILFSNDAFGQHIATFQRFEDEVGPDAMHEATKYYAVIVSVYARQVQEKLAEIKKMNVAISMIAPAHGTMWRQPEKIVDAYQKWSSGEADRKITIVFDSMWHNTEKMAREIERGIASEGVAVSVFNVRTSDWSEVIKEILESRLLLVGSPTLNMGMYPSVGGFLTLLKGLKPFNKKAAAFGSYGWGKGAVKAINEEFEKMKLEILDSLEVKYAPTQQDVIACVEYGTAMAKRL